MRLGKFPHELCAALFRKVELVIQLVIILVAAEIPHQLRTHPRAHIGLIGPVVQIAHCQQMVLSGCVHLSCEQPHAQGETSGIGGGIPAGIGLQTAEQILFLKEIQQCIVRAVCIFNIRHTHGIARRYGLLCHVDEGLGVLSRLEVRYEIRLRGTSVQRVDGSALQLRIHQQQEICPLGGVDPKAPCNLQCCLHGVGDLLIGKLRDGISPLAYAIADADKGNIPRHIVDGPIQQQDVEFVYARQGLEFALGQVLFLRIGQNLPVFPMGLAKGRVVVPPQDQIVYDPFFGHIHQPFGGREVLLPPVKPILPAFLRNGFFVCLQFTALGGAELPRLSLVQQSGVLENVRPVRFVVGRLLNIAHPSLKGSPHEGIKDVDVQTGIFPAELYKIIQPLGQLLLTHLMLS